MIDNVGVIFQTISRFLHFFKSVDIVFNNKIYFPSGAITVLRQRIGIQRLTVRFLPGPSFDCRIDRVVAIRFYWPLCFFHAVGYS